MKVILLVQSAEDVAALPAAAVGLKQLSPSAIWLIHSPAVLVDLTEANAENERQIVAINEAIRLAVGREDYTGAEAYKQQRHALTLQKAGDATKGFQQMTADQQEAATKRVFGGFWETRPSATMKLSMHPQHHETGEWIEMLNSLKGAWPSQMQHGDFVVAWPGQFITFPHFIPGKSPLEAFVNDKPTAPAITLDELSAPAAPAPKAVRAKTTGYMAHARYKQLCSSGIDLLGQTAIGYKIDPNGKARMGLVHAIAKHEEANGLLDKAAS